LPGIHPLLEYKGELTNGGCRWNTLRTSSYFCFFLWWPDWLWGDRRYLQGRSLDRGASGHPSNRDYECERESDFPSVGNQSQAFDSCMKTSGSNKAGAPKW